ncbi:hypothetical protein DERF_013124 [Dermatophagoides farinae]|uniref:Uncharacterized protein n=1 Tax=Dermatophagoides farinae TaxID=6954 RepID=A0A922KUM1_DERFA|nr:hypothetical protein DERF_013124 [Dermatophagoides farinae]
MKISTSQQQQKQFSILSSIMSPTSLFHYSSMDNHHHYSSSSSNTTTTASSSSSSSSSVSSPFSSTNRTTQMAMAFLLLLICAQIVTSAPAYDYDKLRDLYEILLRQENPTPFVHQMEHFDLVVVLIHYGMTRCPEVPVIITTTTTTSITVLMKIWKECHINETKKKQVKQNKKWKPSFTTKQQTNNPQ